MEVPIFSQVVWVVMPIVYVNNKQANANTAYVGGSDEAIKEAERIMATGAWGLETGPNEKDVITLFAPKYIQKIYIYPKQVTKGQ